MGRCLEQFLKEETLNDCRCSNESCKAKEMSKKLSITKTPQVLIVQLKRFAIVQNGKWQWQDKIFKEVEFPTQLKLLNDTYELIGTTSHFGSVASGHYTAQCKDPIKVRWWNNFNDSDSSEITVDEIDKSGVYILFYQKRSNDSL